MNVVIAFALLIAEMGERARKYVREVGARGECLSLKTIIGVTWSDLYEVTLDGEELARSEEKAFAFGRILFNSIIPGYYAKEFTPLKVS